jgi:hypothetical protein
MRIAFVLSLVILIIMGFINPLHKTLTKDQNPKGFAVVELFTSEGCSSCPAADEAVIDIAREYKSNVFIIGFHVDYWNSLGWKDAFSNASYTDRQKQYAGIFGLNSIYTPQIIVNGSTEFVGSDKKRLYDAVNQELKKTTTSTIEIIARTNGNNTINVSYTIKPSTNDVLNIILVQLHTQTDVKRGENSGRQLHHINIARDFKTINAGNNQGNISLTIPNGLTPKDCRVIAYLQDKGNWRIKDAAEAKVE